MTLQPGTNNYNTRIAEYLTKKGNQTMKFGQLLEYIREIFSLKSMQKMRQGE